MRRIGERREQRGRLRWLRLRRLRRASRRSSQPLFEPDEAATKAAKSELNLLAQVIGGGGGAGAKETEKFSIVNLFPDTSLTGDAGGEAAADFITFDAEDRHARASALSKSFGGLNVESSGADDEDLLDLMDKQGGKSFDD